VLLAIVTVVGMDDVEHEVRELRTEVARHHRDFQRIVEVLDPPEREDVTVADALRQIRNIVG
jgi:hypothetical protein